MTLQLFCYLIEWDISFWLLGANKCTFSFVNVLSVKKNVQLFTLDKGNMPKEVIYISFSVNNQRVSHLKRK